MALLRDRGASFCDDLMREARLDVGPFEAALGDLVSRGLITSDGFSGLRALIAPANKRRRAQRQRWRRHMTGLDSAGRWSPTRSEPIDQDALHMIAWQLLQRWGVVFRRVIDREGTLPPWRDLLRVYRRLEARGEIRGGRFVAGFAGEQYALPDAVGSLRKIRREGTQRGELVSISAADPLNLVGIITPGKRVAAIPSHRILLCDGIPIAVKDAGEIRLLQTTDLAGDDLEAALARPRIPPAVRAYA